MNRRVVAILIMAVPFVFALIRAFRTGADLRYFWMAVASFVAVTLVMVLTKARTRSRVEVLSLSIIAFIVSAAATALVAKMLGSRAVSGVALVALSFALFSAGGEALYILSRGHRR